MRRASILTGPWTHHPPFADSKTNNFQVVHSNHLHSLPVLIRIISAVGPCIWAASEAGRGDAHTPQSSVASCLMTWFILSVTKNSLHSMSLRWDTGTCSLMYLLFRTLHTSNTSSTWFIYLIAGFMWCDVKSVTHKCFFIWEAIHNSVLPFWIFSKSVWFMVSMDFNEIP